uniref:Protein kinase domain-containing protein n=1 Tax=Xenopus tropicalis TaxID=8364 RepID=A0A1B8Y5P4_XENTR
MSSEERDPGSPGRKRRRSESEESWGRKKSKKSEETANKSEETANKSEETANKSEETANKRKRSSNDSGTDIEEGISPKRPCRAPPRPLSLTISSYTLHCVLGRGSYGKVALASTATTNQLVAIKTILKRPQKENMEYILREARVLRVAAGHPYLCRAYAAFQTQTRAFFTMEYASGGSLELEIRKRKHLKMRKVIFYSAEIICGLQYLHSHGIIHRDIKPGNIMLSSEGHIKILDFGLAAEGVYGDSTTNGRFGTFAYMAPEVHREKEYSAAVDWWSYGITLCQMATGQYPFHLGNNLQDLRRSILREQPTYPAWIGRKLHRLLGKQSVEDFDECVMTPMQFVEDPAPSGNYIIKDFSYQSVGWEA